MDLEENLNVLTEINPSIILCDGFEEALVGYCDIFNKTIAIYDLKKCINILINRDNLTEEEALEYYYFNIIGSSIDSENNPGFITFF